MRSESLGKDWDEIRLFFEPESGGVMACEYICDGCGKRFKSKRQHDGHNWIKPDDWFQRSDREGIQDACSRKCIEKIAKETGKTAVVAPF